MSGCCVISFLLFLIHSFFHLHFKNVFYVKFLNFVKVIYIVMFLVSPKVVIPGQVVRMYRPAFRLSCSATGTPPIKIELIRNSTILVNATNTASIPAAEEGNYTCRATSKYGTDEIVFQVINGEDKHIIDFSFSYCKNCLETFKLSDIHCAECNHEGGGGGRYLYIILHPFAISCYFTFPISFNLFCKSIYDMMVLRSKNQSM